MSNRIDFNYRMYNDWKEYSKTGDSINDQLSEDVDKTIETWLAEGYQEMDPKDIISNLNTSDNIKIRYINNDMMCRKGGILTAVINEDNKQFLRVKNNAANVCWSVQISNLYKLYYQQIKSKSTKPKEPKVKKIKEPQYTEEQIEAAIEEAAEQTLSRSADKNYKYIQEVMGINIPRSVIRNYFFENS